MAVRRLVVGLTGASMPQLGIRLLQVLQDTAVETHLIISKGARRTIAIEATGWTVAAVQGLGGVLPRCRGWRMWCMLRRIWRRRCPVVRS